MVASCSGCAVLVWAAGPSSTMRSASRADLALSCGLQGQGGKTVPHVDGGARSASFDCAHGSSTSFLWRVETGKEGVMRGFWKSGAGSCGLPPLFRCLPRFRVNPHWRTKVLPIRRSRPEMRPARKGALAVGERMAQLYDLRCARPGGLVRLRNGLSRKKIESVQCFT